MLASDLTYQGGMEGPPHLPDRIRVPHRGISQSIKLISGIWSQLLSSGSLSNMEPEGVPMA